MAVGEATVMGETLVGVLADIVQALTTDIRPSAMGPVAPAGSLSTWIQALVKLKLPVPASQVLSKNVKVK